VNALANEKVAEYINEHFVATYLKVGTFRIINGQKVGGNVASYFCLPDGSVVHAVPGKLEADAFLQEARWAYETRKLAQTVGTNLVTGEFEQWKFYLQVKQAHEERYFAARNPHWMRLNAQGGAPLGRLPATMPGGSNQARAHWLLGTNPLAKIDAVYPVVWEQILNEPLSALPVVKQ